MQPSAAVLDDSLLLRSYADRRDAAAFAELVRRYADMVYATARRVTGSAAEAEDVAQDCFLRLAQGSAVISGSLAAWLHRTSLNRALEVVRSEQARGRREANFAAATDAARAGAITADDSRELIARVDEALTALADELRIPLTEHFLCGRSQSDIALAAGVNQSMISRRIEAGLSELRQRLRAAGVAPAAVAALPLLFGQGAPAAALAPPGLRAALAKIGMSGVGPATTPAAAGLAAAGISATSRTIALLAGAAVIVLAGGWWLAGLRSSPAPRRVTLPISAAATQASATRPSIADDGDDNDARIADGLDDLMDRDDGDDDDDDLIPTSAPARR